MVMRHWLMGLVVAAAAQAAVASADELKLAPKAGIDASSAGTETKANGGQANSASEPIVGGYNFLLEVAGVTPAEPSQERKRSPGPSLHRAPQAARKAIGSAD